MTYSINSREMRALRDWLKEERLARNYSMRDLANRLGKPHTYVQKVEQGERRLDVIEFVWYCRELGSNPLVLINALCTLAGIEQASS